jgi:hypothetical protein
VTAGVDWASTDHVACVVDAAGKVVTRFTAAHTADGLKALVKGLARVRAAEVAIERGDGLMAGALLAAGLTVVVISPNQVKNLRSRYGSAGNKDDRFDAFVLADTLRTDRARLRPLTPGTPATITLRSAVRARRDLVAHRVAMCNQLRAHLALVFPAAVGLFADLDSPVSLAFLARFDCQDRADWLSPRRMAAWLKSAGYSAAPPATTAPPGLTSPAPWSPCWSPSPGRSRPWQPRSPSSPACTQTGMSSRRCPARAPSAPPGCSPRSATAASVSPTLPR